MSSGGSRDVCVVGVARTPCGSLQGQLSTFKAAELAALAIKEAVGRAGLRPTDVEELILGHAISAGAGQAPAKQAAAGAGLPASVVCSTVNKVCASGMKGATWPDDKSFNEKVDKTWFGCFAAVMLGAQAIMLGLRDVVVVGGMESMSQAPHLSKRVRGGVRCGNLVFSDALQTVGSGDVLFRDSCVIKVDVWR
jgi:acetyl-CoA C-acetyltransferase